LSEIRATYSGVISFAVTMLNVLLGLAFMMIVTRTLSVEDFGIWNVIISLIVYSLILDPIISFWATREIARKNESGKTAILSSGIFSTIGIGIYLIISYFTGLESNIDIEILWFAVFLIPLTFIFKSLQSVNYATKPHIVSIGQTVSIAIKIPIAFYLLYVLDYGIQGIIFVHASGLMASSIILFIYARNKFKNKFNIKLLVNWIKFSWLSVYPRISFFLLSLDIIIFTIITSSVVGVAYYSVALVIGGLVTYSEKFSQPMYAKLLGGGNLDQIQNNLTRFFYFAFPLTAISIVFSQAGLHILNPAYELAGYVVIILALKFLLMSIKHTLSLYLQGEEKVDKEIGSKFKDYIKSQLFFLPTLGIVTYSVYLTSLVVGLIIFSNNYSPIELVTYWAALGLIIEIPVTIYIYSKISKKFSLSLEKKPIFKFLIGSVFAFGLVFLATERFLVYTDTLFIFIPKFLLFVTLGVLTYLGVTLVIDIQTREFVKSILKEIFKKN
jgi:hypothetical protein